MDNAKKIIGFKFCDIGFGFGGYDQNFCIFFFYGFAYLFYIFIEIGRAHV